MPAINNKVGTRGGKGRGQGSEGRVGGKGRREGSEGRVGGKGGG